MGVYIKPSCLYLPLWKAVNAVGIISFVGAGDVEKMAMLKEFRTIHYDQRHWVRYATWLGLGGATLLLLWSEGGFPPAVWRVFAHTMQQFPHAWATRGTTALFALSGLGLLSLMWLLSWGLVLWVSGTLLWPHKRDARYIAWRESRNLGIRTRKGAMDESTLEGDFVSIPKLRLPQRSETNAVRPEKEVDETRPVRHIPVTKHMTPRSLRDIRASKDMNNTPTRDDEQQFRTLARPALVAVGQTQRVHSTTPLPPNIQVQAAPRSNYSWQREQKSRPIDDIPTTPERPSRAGSVGTLVRTRTKLEVGVGWNSGITRKQQPNEDSLVVLQGTCTYNDRLVPFGLFVVADGMGGHDFGQEASHIAIQSMMQGVLRDIVASDSLNDTIIIDLLVNGVEQANTAICKRCREWGKDMGTTLTATLIVDIKAYVVNVGDSRTYLYDDANGLTQVTRDHSLVANLVMAGAITPEEVYTHPERNKVYRSLGNRDGVEVDWFTRELRRGDSILLCSDGLWEMVRDPDIRLLLSSGHEPTQVCDMLVHAALRGGGADNVSVIVVRVG